MIWYKPSSSWNDGQVRFNLSGTSLEKNSFKPIKELVHLIYRAGSEGRGF